MGNCVTSEPVKPPDSQASIENELIKEIGYTKRGILCCLKQPSHINWPWMVQVHCGAEDEIWEHFDDILCIYIELQYKKFMQRDSMSDLNAFRLFQISPKKSIDLKNMVEFETSNPEKKRKIIRSEFQEDRRRSLGDFRNSFYDCLLLDNQQGDTTKCNSNFQIGWLAKQWFNKKDRGPTKQELKQGLLAEAEREAQFVWKLESQESKQKAIDKTKALWIVLLMTTAITKGDKKALIDLDVLMNKPDHQLVKSLMYLYSLDSFIAKNLKQAGIDQDESRVETLGPLAYCLQCVIDTCNLMREDENIQKSPFVVWQAEYLSDSELESLVNLNSGQENLKQLSLRSIATCTTDRQVCEERARACHAQGLLDDNKQKLVVFKIQVYRNDYLFWLSDKDYSPYHADEKEVLLQEGSQLKIKEIEQPNGVQTATVINQQNHKSEIATVIQLDFHGIN